MDKRVFRHERMKPRPFVSPVLARGEIKARDFNKEPKCREETCGDEGGEAEEGTEEGRRMRTGLKVWIL